MIVKDEKILREKSTFVETLEEAKQISALLETELDRRGQGDVGLSAPQIGIQKCVVYVRAKNPIFLVNPEITDAEGESWFQEGCLSFPEKSVRTKRFTDITVKAQWANVDNEWKENVTLNFQPNDRTTVQDVSYLECVAVQHEIDHLNGILMFDRAWEPIRNGKKYKPNDKVTIRNPKTGVVMEEMKYKKVQNFLRDGWEIDE